MATFAYIARDTGGKQISGTLSGPTRQIVLAELQSRSLAPVSVREVHEQQLMKRRISLRQRSIAYRQLADLLRAGVPLLRALRILGRSKAFPRLARIMSKVADGVKVRMHSQVTFQGKATFFRMIYRELNRTMNSGKLCPRYFCPGGRCPGGRCPGGLCPNNLRTNPVQRGRTNRDHNVSGAGRMAMQVILLDGNDMIRWEVG